ncbi:MAG TPA: AAA family ATPase [Actinomycetes bacterium]|nr:AAA family ATPase [Actinomycetes bacterium]
MATRFSSPTFVGRAAQLGLLEDARRRAAAGPSAVVVVGGEAGVGKTRLIDEFAHRCRAEGVRVLVGACVELGEQGVPFAPVVSAVRGMLRTMEPEEARRSIGHGRTDLSRLLPELGAPPGGDGQTVGPELASAQGRLFGLLLDLVEWAAGQQPTVLVVEDLHWADQSTRELLGFLVRGLRRPGLLLVLTYRTDELHRRHPLRPFLAELERIGWVERVELRRFDRPELVVQLTGILDEPPNEMLVDEVFERAQGNPFFAEGEQLAADQLGAAADVMLAHPLALQLRNLQSLVELGVDKNTTVVFPAPLMSTIQELGTFLAQEHTAATPPPSPTAADPPATDAKPPTEHPPLDVTSLRGRHAMGLRDAMRIKVSAPAGTRLVEGS